MMSEVEQIERQIQSLDDEAHAQSTDGREFRMTTLNQFAGRAAYAYVYGRDAAGRTGRWSRPAGADLLLARDPAPAGHRQRISGVIPGNLL
jgi:hypothetical protein